jgi:Outer membrane protein beta-barrel domain
MHLPYPRPTRRWVRASAKGSERLVLKNFAIGTLITVTVLFEAGTLAAQDSRGYFGLIGGMSTLSADGRSITTPEASSVSLYDPTNGPALNVFGGWSLSNYVSLQGNYIWNRNRLTLTSATASPDATSFYEQRRTSSHHSLFADLLVYFRARGERVRPYLSTGIGRVSFSSTEERTLVTVGATEIPPAGFDDTTVVLRSAVGIDVRVGRGWAVRYSFSEFIGPNPIGRQLHPAGKRSLMNFQNLVGFVRYF